MSEHTRLLLAEDDRALGELLQEYLTAVGYEVELYHSCTQAIEAFRQKHHDLILSDIVFPDEKNGWNILQEASGDPAATLVVLMTGFSSLDDAIAAVERGAYDFVSKPFQFPEIRIRLDNAVRYQKLLRRLQQQEHVGEHPLYDKTSWSFASQAYDRHK